MDTNRIEAARAALASGVQSRLAFFNASDMTFRPSDLSDGLTNEKRQAEKDQRLEAARIVAAEDGLELEGWPPSLREIKMDKYDMIDQMTDAEVEAAKFVALSDELGSRYCRSLVVESAVRAHRSFCADYQRAGSCSHRFAMNGEYEAIRL